MGRAREELIPGPALEAALSRGVPPLVALVGDEDFLKEDALRQVRGAVGAEAELEAFDGPRNDTEAAVFDRARVFDALRTGSLFGGDRIVAVRCADRFVKDAAEPLGRLFESPVRGALLVLFLARIDGRTRLAKVLGRTGLRVTCKRLFDRPAPWLADRVPAHDHELSRWTQARARRAGKRMGLEVAHELTRHTGNDLGRIAGAIENLVILVGERPEIDAATVSDAVGGTGEQTVFRICDEILDGNTAAAFRTLQAMHRSGLDMLQKTVLKPEAITLITISQLFKRLRPLYQARRAFEEGMPPPEVMQRFGPSQRGFQPVFERHLSRFDAMTMRRGVSGLRRMETAVKTGGAAGGPALMFETFVADLCRARPPARRFPPQARGGGGRRWG